MARNKGQQPARRMATTIRLGAGHRHVTMTDLDTHETASMDFSKAGWKNLKALSKLLCDMHGITGGKRREVAHAD